MHQPQEEPDPVPLPEHPEGEKVGVPEAPPVLDSAEARDALNCPLCKYSLRGLANVPHPRCPECGYRFTWAELLTARQNLHPYLFEHHLPGNVRSFFLTLWHGLRPATFWARLNAAHAVNATRLHVYTALVTVLLAASLWAGWYLAHAGALYANNQHLTRALWAGPQPLPPDPAFFARALDYGDFGGLKAHVLLTASTWPWLTLAALLVFRASMRRAGVGFGHVLRCVVYSFDAFAWMFAFGLLAGLAVAFGPEPARLRFIDAAQRYLVVGLFTTVGLATYRLGQSYRRYLRFDHPWATVIISQVLVVLSVATFLAAVDPAIWELFW
ncbi:MAG TPA: hypothetical protein VFB66_23740 [Tepidisphaeraceae bacterium]|nr:hypothetical protein [Tepidisphaeraceae bacterium]